MDPDSVLFSFYAGLLHFTLSGLFYVRTLTNQTDAATTQIKPPSQLKKQDSVFTKRFNAP